MHFEILVEDQSGKKMLDIIVSKLVGNDHTFSIHAYKGIGRIPKNLHFIKNPTNRILLTQLPRLLSGYGKTFSQYPDNYPAAVILVCDLDDKCLKEFRKELLSILNNCNPQPETRFCIAIEEGEAWFLGDIPAIKRAYPNADMNILNAYINDSICGTWELLANALFKKGAVALSKKGWQAIGTEKSKWAEKISPHMNMNENNSPSFLYFKKKLLELIDK